VYHLHDQKIDTLAYADDLALIAKTPAELQQLMNIIGRVATWAGLRFNARKCATLHIDGRHKEAVRTCFDIREGNPVILAEGDEYEHLGVPTGYHMAYSAEKVLDKMTANLDKVDASLLAPWQKFDAINTFVLPCISFHLKNGAVRKQLLTKFDKRLRSAAKKWLNLPQRAGIEPLYLSNQMGGMNLLPTNLLVDVSQIVHGLRLLESPSIRPLANAILQTVVEKRTRRPLQPQDQATTYLNGSMDGNFDESTDLTNTWTRLRSATRRLKTKVNVRWHEANKQLQLLLNGSRLAAKHAENALRKAVQGYFRQRLLNKPDQGKVHAVTSVSTASNHFMRDGDFTRFAEWRFIHRARLDCVPLNGTKRFGSGDKRCRRCGHANETFPHVLNHCKPHFAAITRRHNAILDRLAKAYKPLPQTTVRLNQAMPGFDDGLRPDLVITNNTEKWVTIIDVASPFENRYAAFEAARNEKMTTYDHIARKLRQDGFEVYLDAFIVGALGGWDPANERIIMRLRLGHNYCRLMRRLMCTDAIKWSRDIYVEHVTGTRQYGDA
jgi:hypothetical protein